MPCWLRRENQSRRVAKSRRPMLACGLAFFETHVRLASSIAREACFVTQAAAMCGQGQGYDKFGVVSHEARPALMLLWPGIDVALARISAVMTLALAWHIITPCKTSQLNQPVPMSFAGSLAAQSRKVACQPVLGWSGRQSPNRASTSAQRWATRKT